MAGVRPRLHANLEALRTLRQIQAETRPATADEQRVLARWSGWGAIAQQAFHPSYADEFGAEQAELRSLLDRREYAAARRSTLNAHYTDASLVQAIWDAVSDLGVQGGNILEPGCGSGNFLGFAPQDVHMLGVELDSTSAAISALLYPHAQVRNESFAETVSPDSVFDAAVGNVPFGDHALYDSRHNPARLSIHNHFIVKSLDLVKPGGVVAMVTSHYTMDSQSTTARSEIIKRADILGVVRLPSSAHQAAAGTKVVTDVVLLRKRSAGEPSAHLASITNGLRDLGAEDPDCDAPVWANTYFDDHSKHLLGEATWRMGQYGPELDVVGPAQGLGERLRHVLGEIVQTAKAEGLAAVPAPEGTERLELADLASAKYEGLLQVDQAGHLTKMRHGRPEPYIPSKEKAELVKLLRMRDTVRDLLDAQNATAVETPHILDLRKQLNEQYDAYVAAHGYINRRSVNKNGVASRPFQGGFRHDPLSSYVYGLEHYDTETGTGSKMEVFYQRVLNPSREVTRADTPQDALYVCLREVGEVDLDRIASLLGEENRDKAREALGDLVYTDPTDGRLVSAPEYLSGDVRVKLRQAREAAELDPALAVNVRALEDVQRPELTAAEIIPQLGAAWIDDSYVQQFAREVLENDLIEVQHAGHNVWWVSDHGKGSPLATEMFGTKRRSANELLASALAQKRVEVGSPPRARGSHRGRVP